MANGSNEKFQELMAGVRKAYDRQVQGEQYSPMEGVVHVGYKEGDSGYVRENKGTFFGRLEGRFAPSDLLKIKLAYMLAKYGHRGQERKELDREGRKVRYFEHVRRVALILIDTPVLREVLTPEAVCIALLHDVLEDTEDISAEMLEMMFGKEVTLGVMAMTKRKGLSTLDYQDVLMSHRIAKWIKLCDRVDNMRHCRTEYVGEEFRVKQKVETREEWMDWFRMVGGENHPLVLELWEMVNKS